MRTENKFWAALFVLILLCAPAVAFDGQKVECPSFKSSIPGDYTGWPYKWNPASDDEIESGCTAYVSVIDGVPPYKWSVSGTGFWLSSEGGLSNTLNADDTACGTATITVTDNYGDKVKGYVRCTNGQWVLKDQCGNNSGWNCTHIEGNKKWTLSWWCGTGDPGYNYCGMDCMCLCTSYWGEIACSGSPGGNCYPCWFVKANCNDPNNPNNYAWPAYWYYEWGCPP